MSLKTKLFLVGVLLVNIQLFAQVTVSGKVTDENNAPIPGANVVVVNSTRGVQTDIDGNYSIEVSSGESLRFSYVGYAAQTVEITNQQTLDISLQEDTAQLDEVVAVVVDLDAVPVVEVVAVAAGGNPFRANAVYCRQWHAL